MNAGEALAKEVMDTVQPLLDAHERTGAMKLGSAVINYIESEFDVASTSEQVALLRVAQFVNKILDEVRG